MRVGRLILAIGILTASAGAGAQTVCLTPNCVFAGTPAACANRAEPRTPVVFMGSGGNLVFDPPDPRIEPGDCIVWKSSSSTHSASGNACPDVASCNAASPAGCQFETANVSGASATPTATCFYDPEAFPAGTGNGYYCRIHASPTSGSMRGTLMVTSEINLIVGKDTGTNSVKLFWTGGGVTGDVSYKVARQSGGDPAFPAATTVTTDPDGGALDTTFTDVGDLADPTARYYLVRNKQTNEH